MGIPCILQAGERVVSSEEVRAMETPSMREFWRLYGRRRADGGTQGGESDDD